MRAAVVLLHRYVGLALLGFLTVAGVTGSLLAFQAELDALLNPSLFHVAPAESQLPLSRLVAVVQDSQADVMDGKALVAGIRLPSQENDSVIVFLRTGDSYDQVFLDPGTGDVLGRRTSLGSLPFDTAHAIPLIYSLHYSLWLPERWGMWLLGGVALAWMVDSLAGFYLTLPRGRPFWQSWGPSWRIRLRAASYRVVLDLHRAPGLWLWPLLLLLALSSVALNLQAEVFRPVLQALLPTTPRIWDERAGMAAAPMVLGFEDAMAAGQAEARRLGWVEPAAGIQAYPRYGLYRVTFGRGEDGGLGPSSVYVAASDGSILRSEVASAGTSGDVVARAMFPLHSGQIAGLPGRIVICATGLAIALLSVTGGIVWWKKRRGRVQRVQRARLGEQGQRPSQIGVACGIYHDRYYDHRGAHERSPGEAVQARPQPGRAPAQGLSPAGDGGESDPHGPRRPA